MEASNEISQQPTRNTDFFQRHLAAFHEATFQGEDNPSKNLQDELPKKKPKSSRLLANISLSLSLYIYIYHSYYRYKYVHNVCMYVCMHACMYIYIYVRKNHSFQSGMKWYEMQVIHI